MTEFTSTGVAYAEVEAGSPGAVPIGSSSKDAAGGVRFQLARRALGLWRTRIGLGLVGLVVLVAAVGPFVAPHSPYSFVGQPFDQPSSGLPFGTDVLGRDVLSRFLNGGYVLLILAAIATVLGVATGTLLGLVAGYSRGRLDDVIMRSLDVILCFPAVVFALLLVSVIGSKLWLLVIAVALFHVPPVARVIRGATVQLTGREFIGYAETIGVRKLRLVVGEILPNVTAPLSVEIGLRMTYSIATLASLAFLGFGRQPPAPDWGLMINENRIGLTTQPWGVLLPIIAIAAVTVGMSLLTDGIGRAAAGLDRQVDIGEES